MTTAPVACGQRGEEIWPVASSRGDLWATIPFECVPRAAGADEPRFAAARRHWSRRARPPRAPGRDLIDAHGTETSLSQCNTFVTAVHAPRRRSHARKGRLVPRASSLALGSRRAARARAWAAVMAGGSTKTVLVDMATGGALGGVTRPRGGGGPRGASAPPHTGGSRRGSDRYRRDHPTPNPYPDPNLDPVPRPRLKWRHPSLTHSLTHSRCLLLRGRTLTSLSRACRRANSHLKRKLGSEETPSSWWRWPPPSTPVEEEPPGSAPGPGTGPCRRSPTKQR